ncbi:protein-disulfide reductase DsbD domain-containing protein [Kordia algicida OT-1]|uniref:Thiol:disulfide interchange protein dsbD, putative n=1 Tax=Kordia algicida OT-1 TaxID=391587 RepID=A9DXE0_9FLAO|nr:protein-disulfide reductase DsbD domain-containing protein [Kordia algicida]EDP95992.1 thiol:disulfide interchange protein dsbD, putative [Kordia algicida OT-1]
MKKLFTLLLLCLSSFAVHAQMDDPVQWTTEIEKISDTEFNLIYKAEIKTKWRLYSQYLTENSGYPTEFMYDSVQQINDFKLVGKNKESKGITKFDKVFQAELTYFTGTTTFTQKVKVINPNLTTITSEVTYQSCDDEKCVLGDEKFTFQLPGREAVAENAFQNEQPKVFDPVQWKGSVIQYSDEEYELVMTASIEDKWHLYSQRSYGDDGPFPTEFTFLEEGIGYEAIGKVTESDTKEVFDKVFQKNISFYEKEAVFRQQIIVKDTLTKKITAEVLFMVCDDEKCLPPTVKTIKFDLEKAIVKSEKKKPKRSLWATFFIAFGLGFGVLLTPCVFPMIPMTVSFFTKQSKTRAEGIRNALLYGLFIIIIYTGLGTAMSALFGSNFMYDLSTGVPFNLIMFFVLLIFAFSFMGAFEIMLPNSWMNKVDQQSNRGGIIGIFFMALALAVVSFSCTFPIAGTALLEAATIGGITPIISMLGFSFAIAIPFALFAIFPGWMNSLPKSGGWLNTVKVVLGFLELAFAFKFLSMVDIVLDLHILDREVFLAIWVAIFGTLAMYLFGKIQLPHDSPLQKISVGRACLGMLTLAFTIYMLPGLWGAPLKLISGFPPPMNGNSESPYGVGYTKKTQASVNYSDVSKDAPILEEEVSHEGPHGIIAFLDYEKGLEYAKKVNKPVMIDFTGKTCVNCRKMEEQVWTEGNILSMIKNDVVLISLYADNRKKLPKAEQYESKITGNSIRTIGDKWKEFQQVNYNTNAQPLYVIQDVNGNDISEAVAYTPDPIAYEKWLSDGIKAFKEKSN